MDYVHTASNITIISSDSSTMTPQIIHSPFRLSVSTFEFWKSVQIIIENLYIFPVLPPTSWRIIPHKNNTHGPANIKGMLPGPQNTGLTHLSSSLSIPVITGGVLNKYSRQQHLP